MRRFIGCRGVINRSGEIFLWWSWFSIVVFFKDDGCGFEVWGRCGARATVPLDVVFLRSVSVVPHFIYAGVVGETFGFVE